MEDVEQAWRVLSCKRSVLLNVEDILGHSICAAWVDRVAKRIRGNSGSLERDRRASVVRAKYAISSDEDLLKVCAMFPELIHR
ncbi:unnamed protein product [Dovyalis caffra]|uniref:Uncharacterized protein n=1 Tax=Dovyalis caffra TaxID=77055 RepID=A0AAV1R262_9ROSI|nr:unnamed protein product [Dovyalis caffra]